jgi:hypothetical protein
MVEKSSGGFWSSLPGILTGFAAVITAITGLYLAIQSNSPDTAHSVKNTSANQTGQVVKEKILPERNVQQGQQSNQQPTSSAPQSHSAITTVTVQKQPQGIPNGSSKATVKATPSKAIIANREQIRHQQVPKLAQINVASPVDCKAFPTENSVRSLMSWSNYYHSQIEEAGTNKKRAFRPCKKTIEYRARAHCKTPHDTMVRQALFETLSLCRAAGISWKEILVSQ